MPEEPKDSNTTWPMGGRGGEGRGRWRGGEKGEREVEGRGEQREAEGRGGDGGRNELPYTTHHECHTFMQSLFICGQWDMDRRLCIHVHQY